MSEGRELVTTDVLTELHVARFEAVIGPGSSSNPLIAWTLALPVGGSLAADGTEATDALLGAAPLPLRMQAGSSMRVITPITVGAAITRSTTLESVRRVTSHGGAERVFATFHHTLTADANLVALGSHTVVYREHGPPGRGRTRPGEPTWTQTRSASEVDLFHYSALTFNAYRIHYDRDFCRDAGYPDLVVHGPLLATWLMEAARPHVGGGCRTFDYRALAPVFVGERVRLCGRPVGTAWQCWVERPDGAVAITAMVESLGESQVIE